MGVLLTKLIKRGAGLSVEQGVIRIRPPNEDQRSADQWLAEHYDQLLIEILRATGQPAYRYVGYSTGCYGRYKAGGVTLQLIDTLTGEPVYCVFNVDVRRARTTRHGKRGSMLPPGHFTASKGSSFVLFWQRAGLALPSRLSAFHDCMGKLAPIAFVGETPEPGKLDKQRLCPLEITHEQLTEAADLLACSPDKRPTTSRQVPDNCPTSGPDKETPQRQQPRGIQPESGTCANHHGSRLTVTRLKGEPLPPEPDPWLLEYEQALAESKPH